MNRKSALFMRVSGGLVLSGILAAHAQAQSSKPEPTPVEAKSTSAALSEIVVTARRREENIQTVPESVTAISGAQLSEQRVQSIQDLTTIAPSMISVPTAGNSRQADAISIRGQGGDNGVVQYFAEVPNAITPRGTVSFNTTFFDIANVQVLNGPQGTLFGKTTTGGAILITPVRPSATPSGYLAVRAGNYNMKEIEGAYGSSLFGSDKVLFRVAFIKRSRDGFTRNLQGKNVDNVNRDSIRLSLIVRPIDKLENYTIAYYDRVAEQEPGMSITDAFPTINPAILGQVQADVAAQKARGPRVVDLTPFAAHVHVPGIINITTYDFSEHLHLKNIASYRRERVDNFFSNFDGSRFPLLDLSRIPGFK
ncbi:MAG: TonB-dependent receptor plug domain-containing protein, partial [Phenylobacterium sp.]